VPPGLLELEESDDPAQRASQDHTGYVGPRPRLWDVSLRLVNRRLNRGSLRIIMYHGICADYERDLPWVPSHYVTQSALDDQLGTMRRIGSVVGLREVLGLLRSGRTWRQPLFAITFDDAPANLVRLAAPVLAAHDVSATIFACTDRLEDGGMLEDDARQALLGPGGRRGGAAVTNPVDPDAIDPNVRESLRCMRWDKALAMVRAGHWLGAHARSHVNLARTEPAKRREEIRGSIAAIRDRLNTSNVPLAYPYGQRSDFGPEDVRLLRELDVPLACTGIAGGNRPPVDLLHLRRNCVGLFHTRTTFAVEVLGLLDRRRRAKAERIACACHGKH